MTHDELNEEFGVAGRRWEEMHQLCLSADGEQKLHAAISELEIDDLRFMVLERLMKETSAERAATLLSREED